MKYKEFLELMATANRNEDSLTDPKAILLEYAESVSDCDICPFYEDCTATLGKNGLRYCVDYLSKKLDMSGVLL